MNSFPAQYSTLSSATLKDHIEKAYGFTGITCNFFVRNVSDVYILKHADVKYIFKVYRKSYRGLDEIKAEVELLDILKENGVPVSYAIADLTGNQLQAFQAAEGLRHGVLFSFAKGRASMNPDEQQLRIIGRNLALMHNITSVCQLQHQRVIYNIDTTLKHPLKIIKNRFAELPGEYAFLTELADKVARKFKQFNLSGFSYGYCHYDLLPKNFHFDEQNNITFFDFDWVGRGFLVNDLMTFYVQLFFLIYFNRITQAEAGNNFRILIDSYREHRIISDSELGAIPYLGIMFWIFAFGFYEVNFDDFSNTFLTSRFMKERVDLVKKWADWYCKF